MDNLFMFGGMGIDRDTLYDLALLEGGKPEPPVVDRHRPIEFEDLPGGRWLPSIVSPPKSTLRPDYVEGLHHPGSDRIVIYRNRAGKVRSRTADDAGWSVFWIDTQKLLREVADGTLAEVAEVGETLLVEGA